MKTEQAIRKLGQTLWDILGREYIDKYCEDKNGNLVSVSSISVDGIAEELVNAGYGDISEYKAEIERLKEEMSNIRKETAREILDMLYDMGIDQEILECCRLFDVNGVSLAKQMCEKYGVEIEK